MKILLLTDIPPCKNFTAGIVLDQLCRFLPENSVACFAVVNPSIDARLTPDLQSIFIEYVSKPAEDSSFRLPGMLGATYSLVVESFNSLVNIGKIAKKAVDFGKAFGAEAVWCVVQGQTMIQLARPVAEGLGVPLLVQVWDPPFWWMRELRVNRISRSRILREFEDVMRQSAGCATASWAMADEYSQAYGIRTVPVVPSLDRRLAQPPANSIHSGDELVIGMAGQLYSFQEWNVLIEALDNVGWRVGERNVSIRYLGHKASFSAKDRARIEFMGWRSQEETVKLLSEADMLYCPYWFDPSFEIEARLSFPSKLTTYLAAGRPVLFHGPKYASPAKFLEANDAGLACYSLETKDLLEKLSVLVSDENLYGRLTRNANAAFKSNLTLETMHKNFADFLQVERDFLVPLI